MTSATLEGGGVNQILTFADRGGRGGPSKSDILLCPVEETWLVQRQAKKVPEVADTKLYFEWGKNEENGTNHEISQ